MNYFLALFKNKCPRCRTGEIFCTSSSYRKGFMKMHAHCAECGQRTELEPGFYYGSAYVSYAVAIALSVSTFVAWWVIIGFSTEDNRFFWWMGLNALFLVLLQPLLMRLSRTIWLSFFVKYNPNWKTEKPEISERVIEEQMMPAE
ncbi:MAG: DUF983 domain-containing protein [Bacteroidetes bacterium]|nr:DUF983 domain-containing protein [Bacteroidota bacterium]